MTFAVAILILLGVASVGGTLIPQGLAEEVYLQQYGNGLGGIIIALGLHHAYSAWWYIALTVLLLVSLFLCVVIRIGRLKRSIQTKGLKASTRLLGSWTLHVGILVLVVFFALSSALAIDASVYDVPGKTRKLEQFGMQVAFDDFRIKLRADQSVESYESDVRILDMQGNVIAQDTIAVNHPLTVNGVQFSQASYGFALDALIDKNGARLGDAVLYQGEFVSADQGAITIQMVDFHPHYETKNVATLSSEMKMVNPEVLYRMYRHGQLVDMNYLPVGNSLESGEYKVTLDNARMFTVLAVREDPYTMGVLAGAVILVLGLFLVFFGPDGEKKEGVLKEEVLKEAPDREAPDQIVIPKRKSEDLKDHLEENPNSKEVGSER